MKKYWLDTAASCRADLPSKADRAISDVNIGRTEAAPEPVGSLELLETLTFEYYLKFSSATLAVNS